MVRRSHTAMDSRTVLVGELMVGLIIMLVLSYWYKHREPAQDKDDDTVGEEGDAHEDWHEETIDWLNNINLTQPGGCIDYVAASSYWASEIEFIIDGRVPHIGY